MAATQRLKKLWTIAAAFVGLIILGSLCWFGPRLYKTAQHRKAMTNARIALAKSSIAEAFLWAKKALETDPEGIETNRLIADLTGAVNSPEELPWRARVTSLEPGNIGNYVDWASAALHFGQPYVALAVLHKAPAAAARSATWQAVTAAAAAGCGQTKEAGEHFEQASLLEPSNPLNQVNLQIFRMGPPYSEKSAPARDWLQTKIGDPGVGIFAKRALLQDAFNRNDLAQAAPIRAALESDSKIDFNDRLLCLEFDYRKGSYDATLVRLMGTTQQHPELADRLATWMGNHQLGRGAVAWIEKTFPLQQRSIALQISEADIVAALGDWTALSSKLETAKWGNVDFIRLAMLARSDRERGSDGWESRWRAAVESAAASDETLLMLARLAQSWTWFEQAEPLCWRLTDRSAPQEIEAIQRLFEMYESEKDTAGLLRVSKKRLEIAPESIAFRNNYAFLALLLDIDREHSSRIAEENMGKTADVPAIVTTYALSRLRNGNAADAKAALEKLDQKNLRDPDIAIYYAWALHLAGDDPHALEYARAGLTSKKLLPEEKRLLTSIPGIDQE